MNDHPRILVAVDSFKGSLSSLEVAQAAEEGLRRVLPGCRVDCLAVADGGEGTVAALTHALDGRQVRCVVNDPLGRPVEAGYGICGQRAVIEMAAASGLPLVSPAERNPLKTTTFGTGQLIADALEKGCRRFLIGLGGSATNDGGTGMLTALGFRFLDARGHALPGCGGNLSKIVSIDRSAALPALADSTFTVACDVDTPFCGPTGASAVFAPQKGADAAMVRILEEGMASFAERIRLACGVDVSGMSGAGAAGGLGGAFTAFLGGRLVRGVDMVLDEIRFDERVRGADYVITGEGCIDAQTRMGKTPAGVLARSAAAGVPVLAIGGRVVSCPEVEAMGFAAVREVSPRDVPLERAMDPGFARERVAATVAAYFDSL